MSSDNTQLTTATNYDTSRMVFSDPEVGVVPGNGPKMEYKRVPIKTKNPDGTVGELVLKTERIFSFGVGENLGQDGKQNGYSIPLCLWDRTNPTKAEKDWTDTYNNIVEKCKEYLVENREEIDKPDLDMAELKKFGILFKSKEKVIDEKTGKQVTREKKDAGPTLYAKLIFSKKQNKILTQFYNMKNEPIDPIEMLQKWCYVTAAIKIESIYIGVKCSLQVKAYELVVEPVETGIKRLLSVRPAGNSKLLAFDPTDSEPVQLQSDTVDDDDEGSLNGEEFQEEKQPVKKVVKKVVKKKTSA